MWHVFSNMKYEVVSNAEVFFYSFWITIAHHNLVDEGYAICRFIEISIIEMRFPLRKSLFVVYLLLLLIVSY